MERMLIPLGGGDEIGASSYFIQADGSYFLLDCGMRLQTSNSLPDFDFLEKYYIGGFFELDAMVLSHAHYDHIAALPYLASKVDKLTVLANPITKILTKMQLEACNDSGSEQLRQQKKMQIERGINMIEELPFQQVYRTNDFMIEQFQAGHMPGAAMTYIDTGKSRILYTGDFSDIVYNLVGGCILPDRIRDIDLLVLNGTHAYSGSNRSLHGYQSAMHKLEGCLRQTPFIQFKTCNITKGLELARCIESQVSEQDLPLRIYIDDRLAEFAEYFAEFNINIFSRLIRPLDELRYDTSPYKVVISQGHGQSIPGFRQLQGSCFSLHADSSAIINLVKKVRAKKVCLVHTEPNSCCLPAMLDMTVREYGGSLEQAVNRQECRF